MILIRYKEKNLIVNTIMIHNTIENVSSCMQSNVRYGEKWLALIGLKIKLMTLVVSSIVYGTRNKGKEDWMEIDVGAKKWKFSNNACHQ